MLDARKNVYFTLAVAAIALLVMFVAWDYNRDTEAEQKANQCINECRQSISRLEFGTMWFGYVTILNKEKALYRDGILTSIERDVLSFKHLDKNGQETKIIKAYVQDSAESVVYDVKIGDRIFIVYCAFFKGATIKMASKDQSIRLNRLTGHLTSR